ncbi:MAG: hypothetical protein ACF8R7_07405 [Phycisphaerales bacterium JB039]
MRTRLAIVLVSSCAAAASAQCDPTWDTAIGNPALESGYCGAFAIWDDGTGPALYAGGSFEVLAGQDIEFLAKYDGSWSELGDGLDGGFTNGFIADLEPFAAPSGEKLIAAGFFATAVSVPGTQSVAAWDGTEWSSLDAGLVSPESVWTLTRGDIGGGERLYFGGAFATIGGVSAGGIAAWDGAGFESVGDGIGIAGDFSPTVFASAIFDDGSGPALYIGGRFNSIDGVPTYTVAKWDGVEWSEVGDGLIATRTPALFGVGCMTIFDDGSGPDLYVAGKDFAPRGGVQTSVAKWDGAEWTNVGQLLTGRITSLMAWDDGAGSALYCTSTADGRLLRLNGGVWEVAFGGVGVSGVKLPSFPGTSPGTNPSAFALGEWDGNLLVGGNFVDVGDPAQDAAGIAMLEPCAGDCYADCDGSGALDFFDFLCFQNAFAAADPYADCDGSGALDFFDFLCFQNEFAAGCP